MRGPSISVRSGQLLTVGPEHVLVVRRALAPPALAYAAIEASILPRFGATLRHGHRSTAADRHDASRDAHKGGRVSHDGCRSVVNLQLIEAAALTAALLIETLVHVYHDNLHA